MRKGGKKKRLSRRGKNFLPCRGLFLKGRTVGEDSLGKMSDLSGKG